MDPRKAQFLKAVVGDDGASALLKAAAAHPDLEWAVFPRVVMSWLEVVGLGPFSAQLPGVDGTHLDLAKAEGGFTGCVTVGDQVYRFESQTLYHVAGGVAVALGGGEPAPPLTSPSLAKLGKSVDLLVRARTLRKAQEALEKHRSKPCAHCGKGPVDHYDERNSPAGKEKHKYETHAQIRDQKREERHQKMVEEMRAQYKKAEHKGGAKGANQPGAAAAPKAPQGPQAPIPTQPKQNQQMKPRKPQLKVTKSEAQAPCRACGGLTFRGDRFVGCLCWADLAKTAKTTPVDGGYVLELGAGWDAEAVATLAESFGR